MGVPDHVRLTGQALRFKAFFNEAVTESATETYRRRVILIRYFLEDDTFELFEEHARNDGLDGSKFLNRQQHDAVTLDSLRVGATLTLYSRTFKIIGCDDFTRAFYEERGQDQEANEDAPEDRFTQTASLEDSKRAGWNGKRINSISRYVEAVRGKAVKKEDTLARFLKHDGETLRFFVVWDQTITSKDVLAEKPTLCIQYFLADHTADIVRTRRPGDPKRSVSARFLMRNRLPKKPMVNDDRERSCEDGKGEEDYFGPEDFRVGETIVVLGKHMVIYDCDDFTQRWYADSMGIDQKAGILDISVAERPKAVVPIPPHHGFGSEEDTLHSMKYLDPQSHPRKSDLRRFQQSKNKTLKFYAGLKTEHPIDKMRKYRITWYLDDDSLSVYEEEVRNAGFLAGKWQARIKMQNPDTGERFKSSEFFLGAEVTIKGHRFVVNSADEFSLRFMEDSSSLWPMSSVDFVLSKLKVKLQEKSASLRKMFRKFDEDHSQTISIKEFNSMLDYFGMTMSMQECVTIFRAFDKDGEGFIDYTEFMEAFTDKDEEGGAAAATASAHVDASAADMSAEAAAEYMAIAAGRAESERVEAATDLLLTRLARGMKQAKSASHMHENFRRFDVNKDHTIDSDEFTAAMGSSGFNLAAKDIELLRGRFFPPGAREMNYETFMGVLHDYADRAMTRT
jgi:Ca2+-binding EF-hand superfamily protein